MASSTFSVNEYVHKHAIAGMNKKIVSIKKKIQANKVSGLNDEHLLEQDIVRCTIKLEKWKKIHESSNSIESKTEVLTEPDIFKIKSQNL